MFRKSFVITGLALAAVVLLSASRFETATSKCESRRLAIVELLSQQGVEQPEFYYYLALAESTCKDEAVSRQGAKSIWQMMPWLIGNRDPLDWMEMTRVAGHYITSIQRRLPSPTPHWIVIAAWNTGLHNLQKECGQVPTESCVRKRFPQAAALADTVTDWSELGL